MAYCCPLLLLLMFLLTGSPCFEHVWFSLIYYKSYIIAYLLDLSYNLWVYSYTKPNLFIPDIFLKWIYLLEKCGTSPPPILICICIAHSIFIYMWKPPLDPQDGGPTIQLIHVTSRQFSMLSTNSREQSLTWTSMAIYSAYYCRKSHKHTLSPHIHM